MTDLEKNAESDLSEFIWDSAIGPMENILTWVNRGLIVLPGGKFAMLMIGLTAAGWDLSALGRKIDDAFDLNEISDLTSLNADKAGAVISEDLWSSLGGSLGALSSVDKRAAEPDAAAVRKVKELRQKELLKLRQDRLDYNKVKDRQSIIEKQRDREFRSQESAKAREYDDAKRREGNAERDRQESRRDSERRDKERREDRREKRREKQENRRARSEKARYKMKYRGMMGRKGKLMAGGGIAAIIALIYKTMANPKSKLSKALRFVGVVGAEQIPGSATQEARQRTVNTPRTTNYRALLENAVDDILK